MQTFEFSMQILGKSVEFRNVSMDSNMVKYVELNKHVTTKSMWNFVNNWSSDSVEICRVFCGDL